MKVGIITLRVITYRDSNSFPNVWCLSLFYTSIEGLRCVPLDTTWHKDVPLRRVLNDPPLSYSTDQDGLVINL